VEDRRRYYINGSDREVARDSLSVSAVIGEVSVDLGGPRYWA
jgi:hypothetical protein